jgi:hypothetical protein
MEMGWDEFLPHRKRNKHRSTPYLELGCAFSGPTFKSCTTTRDLHACWSRPRLSQSDSPVQSISDRSWSKKLFTWCKSQPLRDGLNGS